MRKCQIGTQKSAVPAEDRDEHRAEGEKTMNRKRCQRSEGMDDR